MRKSVAIVLMLSLAANLSASWYWPFDTSALGGGSQPRLSELMEQASLMIDEASDLADAGKVDESVAKYREVITELDRIEREHPERAKTAEFAMVRTKRAYVNARIESMLLDHVRENARAVSVSDTTELERKLASEKWEKSLAEVRVAEPGDLAQAVAKALRLSGDDIETVAACHAGAARFGQVGDFVRSTNLLAHALGNLREMEAVSNSTDRARLTGGLREVKNALAILSMSDRTNDVAFCEGLEASVAIVDRISSETARLTRRRGKAPSKKTPPKERLAEEKPPVRAEAAAGSSAARTNAAPRAAVASGARRRPLSKREQAMRDIVSGDYAAADLVIREMLQAKPNSAAALNLKAAMEMRRGRFREAEDALDLAIMNNGHSHYAYYNMARLMLLKNADDKSRARKYYETGRAYGGPKDAELEVLTK